MTHSTRLFTAQVSVFNWQSSVRSFVFYNDGKNINPFSYIIENNEFIIREGGVPGKVIEETPTTKSNHAERSRFLNDGGEINYNHPGVFQHIAYPTVAQAHDGTIAACYHEWTDEAQPIQLLQCSRFKL